MREAKSSGEGRDHVDADDRDTGSAPGVLRAAEAVTAHLRRTALLPRELVRPARFPALALSLASAGPWMRAADLAVLADVILFIFAVDDLADEGDLPFAELSLRLSQYAASAAGEECPEVAFDPIARALGSIAARLRKAPLGSALWPAWSARVHEMLMAMLDERRMSEALAAGREIPDLESYLDAGRATVGVAVVSTAAWMLIGERAVISAAHELGVAERHLACAARLANDLRSQDREREEGSANAVFLVGPGGESELRERLSRELDCGRTLLAARPRGVDRSARFLLGFAEFVVALYATHDFHTFPGASKAAPSPARSSSL